MGGDDGSRAQNPAWTRRTADETGTIMTAATTYDYAVVGGGVVGLSVAHGLLGRGHRVAVLDEGDEALRASRGNFGLVWVQSKGLDAPHYARWTRRSVHAWRAFADDLAAETGVDTALVQDGGYDFHLTEASLAARLEKYEALRDALDGDYPYDVLGANALRREEPHIGPRVAGAILHAEDGHVNPLRLLRALAQAVRSQGATVHTGATVETIVAEDGGGFHLTAADGTRIQTGRVVLCAGLGAARLGPSLGFRAPVAPQRGQVLITEKLPRLMNRPSGIIRQVDEGGVQIGDSKEHVGFDDAETLAGTAAIAARAATVYPALARARVVRAWGALRVMTPDGLPIYQRSPDHPGAMLVTCHSGITLAAAHARILPDWLDETPDAPDLEAFREDRFPVS
jgi:glycine/D-amino acid oxidase-like deaminating enzyme